MSKQRNAKAKTESARVTIYGKRVERLEIRGQNHYAIFDDGSDLAISPEAYQRIAERLRGVSIQNQFKPEPRTGTTG
ncbi:MAG: hypothetical protein AB1489_08170 [Acidobacteriota bacterium]